MKIKEFAEQDRLADPFRLQHRQHITQVVATVVLEKLSKPQAISHIHSFAQEQIEPQDRERFIEVVENQLLNLHEGNIARYRLRPSEFHAWQAKQCAVNNTLLKQG